MDTNTSGVLGVVAIVVSVLSTVIGIINHKRIVSSCCKRKIEVAIDIEDTRKPNAENISV